MDPLWVYHGSVMAAVGIRGVSDGVSMGHPWNALERRAKVPLYTRSIACTFETRGAQEVEEACTNCTA